MASLRKIEKIVQSDLAEAVEASKNTLLASDHIKATAKLINANMAPESWTIGFVSPPTSLAPVENPELAILAFGSPEEYIRLLPQAAETLARTIATCESQGSQIEIDLQLIPRPQALIEALRRYEGVKNGTELDQVQLFMTTTRPSAPGVVMKKAFTLEGLDCQSLSFDS